MRGTGVEREVERGQGRSPAAAAAEAAQVRRENERCGLAAAMWNGGEAAQAVHGRRHEEERVNGARPSYLRLM